MSIGRREILRSAKTGTVTREAARNAVLATKSYHACKSTSGGEYRVIGENGATLKSSSGSKRR